MGSYITWNATKRSCLALSTGTAINQLNYHLTLPGTVMLWPVAANTDRPLAEGTTFIYQGMQTGIKIVTVFSTLIHVSQERTTTFSQEIIILMFQITKCLDSATDNK